MIQIPTDTSNFSDTLNMCLKEPWDERAYIVHSQREGIHGSILRTEGRESITYWRDWEEKRGQIGIEKGKEVLKFTWDC